MTNWRPAAGAQAARNRAKMMQRIRAYFEAADVLEVDTPALSPYSVSDTQIESFEIPSSLLSQRPMFLHTSPEFCMKRLLCAGYPDIFSICRVFRDGESGRRHQPEFTMIEWYRREFGLREIIDDTLNMIHAALTTSILAREPLQLDYRDCFLKSASVDPLTASVDELAHAAHADSDLRQSVGEERDDWLDLILATRVAPAFDQDRLTVLRHYPASQAALARLCPNDPSVADRFEIFFGPVELANGYVELTDAEEQSHRMHRDNEQRHRRGRRTRPYDTSFLAALESGLPACAGVAVGFERLQMIYERTDDIHDVITFSFEATE
jgi:lysyl-tRNA synthetase class 2